MRLTHNSYTRGPNPIVPSRSGLSDATSKKDRNLCSSAISYQASSVIFHGWTVSYRSFRYGEEASSTSSFNAYDPTLSITTRALKGDGRDR